MFLSLATTHRPAVDLGHLLMKHPDRTHVVDLPFGPAVVMFPEATEARCEAALVLDIDPVGLVRGRGEGDGLLDRYVNDRPYAASSFLAVALNRAYRTAMNGVSRERPDLAAAPIPLEVVVTPLPVAGPDALVARLFEPLGWSVAVERHAGGDGPSRYVTARLSSAGLRLAEALTHLYVLIPVLDDDKHYRIGDDEVEKLIDRAGGWLPGHPERDLIVRRSLKGRRGLVRAALARLMPEEEQEAAGEADAGAEARLEAPIRLHDLRLDTVAAALAAAGARIVADLGCGDGKLIARLLRDDRFLRIVGLDVSSRALERAAERLKPGRPGGAAEGRVTLLHGALTYRDRRWHEADAAALVEVIEHLDPERLPALEAVVFAAARPKTVVVTTPNADYNALFPTLPAGAFRHRDHRFEWTRAEFRAWTERVTAAHGYAADLSDIGEADAALGAPTQMAVFRR